MRKLVFKIAMITLCATLVVAISIFGIASLFAPAAMMDLTAYVGLERISGDYAFQEYERSGSLWHLARSFLISAELNSNKTADRRFTILYENEGFDAFCLLQDENVDQREELSGYSYRSYLCGVAACVRYRLADGETMGSVIEFAASETEQDFPQGNPLIQLTVEASRADDIPFCTLLLEQLEEGNYDRESKDYLNIIAILEGVIHE